MDNFLDNPKKVSDKYLKFTGIYPNHVTNKCKEYVDRIDTLQGEEFSDTLTFWTLETNCDQIDLRQLIPVLENLDSKLNELVSQSNKRSITTNQRKMLVAILKFISFILKRSMHKRFFLSLQIILPLLYFEDIEISELTMEVIFYYSIPSFSATSYTSELEWSEATQLPSEIAEHVLLIYQALGFASDSYGYLDFLLCQEPALSPSDELTINFPKENTSTLNDKVPSLNESIDVKVPLSLPSPLAYEEYYTTLREQYKDTLTRKQYLSLFYILQVSCALNETKRELIPNLSSETGNLRVRLSQFRLKCLLIIVHSQLSVEALSSYVSEGSYVLRDLLALCDISSTQMSELQLNTIDMFKISIAATYSVIGVLEVSLRRRKSWLPAVASQYGLVKAEHVAVGTSNSQEAPWYSILLGACTTITSSILNLNPVRDSSEYKAGDDEGDNSSVLKLEELRLSSRYVELVIELFCICVSTKEYGKIDGESSAFVSLIGTTDSALSVLASAIKDIRITSSVDGDASVDNLDYLITVGYRVWPIIKVFEILDDAITDHPSRDAIFRDAGGLTLVSNYLDMFSSSVSASSNPSGLLVYALSSSNSLNSLLISILALLTTIILTSRRRTTAADSGVHILYQPNFKLLWNFIFDHFNLVSDSYVVLVGCLCELVVAAIDIEPQYLAHFIRDGLHEKIRLFIKKNSCFATICLSNDTTNNLFIHVLALLQSMCITSEGQSVVSTDKLISSVINSAIEIPYTLPSQKLGDVDYHIHFPSLDMVNSLGGEIARLYRDLEQERPFIMKCVKDNFLSCCNWIVDNMDHDLDEYSHRIEMKYNVDKLLMLCTLIDKVASSSSSRSTSQNAFINVFFADDTINLFKLITSVYLIVSYPSPRQLFIQCCNQSIYSRTTAHFGDFYTGRALTSLFKIGSSRNAHFVIPILFSHIEEILTDIIKIKERISSFDNNEDTFKSEDSKQFNNSKSNKTESVPKMKKSSSRVSKSKSLHSSPQGTTTKLLLGVLDNIPDMCVYTKDYENTHSEFLEQDTGIYLQLILQLEWLTWRVIDCLKTSPSSSSSMRASQHAASTEQYLVSEGKDILRRLFSFQRTSLLEVCRFSSTKWVPQVVKSNYLWKAGFNLMPLLDESAFIEESQLTNASRYPHSFKLRVVNPTGTVIKEQCDTDKCRIVLFIPRDSVVIADERKCGKDGIVHYRTAHGWIAESQKNGKNEPVLEILDIMNTSSVHSVASDALGAEFNINERKILRSQTIRESCCFAMCRSNVALKQLALQLSQSVLAESVPHGFSSAGAQLSKNASKISSMLSKITQRFFENPFVDLSSDNIDELSSRDSWALDSINVLAEDDNNSIFGNKKLVEDDSKDDTYGYSAAPNNDTVIPPLYANEKSGHKKQIDDATMALYIGAIMKFMVLPLMDDRNGQVNTYILKYFEEQNLLSGFMKSFHFIVLTLNREIDVCFRNKELKIDCSTNEIVNSSVALSRTARCALYGLLPVLKVIQKISNYQTLLNSPLAALMNRDAPSSYSLNGTQKVENVVTKYIFDISYSVFSIFRGKYFSKFPFEIQSVWFTLIGDLLESVGIIRKKALDGKKVLWNWSDHTPAIAPDSDQQVEDRTNVFRSFLDSRSPAHQSNEEAPAVSLQHAPQSTDAGEGNDAEVDAEDMDDLLAALQLSCELNQHVHMEAPSDLSQTLVESTNGLPINTNPTNLQSPEFALPPHTDLETPRISDSMNNSLSSIRSTGTIQSLRDAFLLSAGKTKLSKDKENKMALENQSNEYVEKASEISKKYNKCIQEVIINIWQSVEQTSTLWKEGVPTNATNLMYLDMDSIAFLTRVSNVEKDALDISSSDVFNSPAVVANVAMSKIQLKDESILYGAMQYMFGYLRFSSIKTPGLGFVIKKILALVLYSIDDAIKALDDKSTSNQWPNWLFFALLICHDVAKVTLRKKADAMNEQSSVYTFSSAVAESKSDNNDHVEIKSNEDTTVVDLDDFLNEDKLLSAVYSMVCKVLQKSVEYPLTSSSCAHSLLLLLSTLLSSNQWANTFLQNTGLLRIVLSLKYIKSDSAVSGNQMLLSSILRYCIETPFLLISGFIHDIQLFFTASNQTELSLTSFLHHLRETSLYSRDVGLCIYALPYIVSFIKKESNSNITAAIKNSASALEEIKLVTCVDVSRDQWSVSTCIQHILAVMQENANPSIDNVESSNVFKASKSLFQVSECLNALADCVLTMKEVGSFVSKFSDININEIGLQNSFGFKLKSSYTFIELMIRYVVYQNSSTEVSLRNINHGATRLIVALCTVRGVPRREALDRVIQVICELKVKSSDTSEELEKHRLIYLGRVAKMLCLVATSCKHSKVSAHEIKKQHVSIDIMHYLHDQGIYVHVYDALRSVSILAPNSGPVIAILMNALEIFSRPTLLRHLAKQNVKCLKKNEDIKISTKDASKPEDSAINAEVFQTGSVDDSVNIASNNNGMTINRRDSEDFAFDGDLRDSILSPEGVSNINPAIMNSYAASHDEDEEEEEEEEENENDDDGEDEEEGDGEEDDENNVEDEEEGDDEPDPNNDDDDDEDEDGGDDDDNDFMEDEGFEDVIETGLRGILGNAVMAGVREDRRNLGVAGRTPSQILMEITSNFETPPDQIRRAERFGIGTMAAAPRPVDREGLWGEEEVDRDAGEENIENDFLNFVRDQALLNFVRTNVNVGDTIRVDDHFLAPLLQGRHRQDNTESNTQQSDSITNSDFLPEGIESALQVNWNLTHPFIQGNSNQISAPPPPQPSNGLSAEGIFRRRGVLDSGSSFASSIPQSTPPVVADVDANAMRLLNNFIQLTAVIATQIPQTAESVESRTPAGDDDDDDDDDGNDGDDHIPPDLESLGSPSDPNIGDSRVIPSNILGIDINGGDQDAASPSDAGEEPDTSSTAVSSEPVDGGSSLVIGLQAAESEDQVGLLRVDDNLLISEEIESRIENALNLTEIGIDITDSSAINEDDIPDITHITHIAVNDIALNESNIIIENSEGQDMTEQANPEIVCPPGYDVDVFNSLPEFMQREVMEQHEELSLQNRELIEEAGYDLETLNALPESIRQEILEQARSDRQRRLNSGGDVQSQGPAEIDNNTFLTSLTPELRAEVLMTSDPEFIATLNPELVAEAQLLRERAAARWQRMELGGGMDHNLLQARGDPGLMSTGFDTTENPAARPYSARRGLASSTPLHAEQTLAAAINRKPGKVALTESDITDVTFPVHVIAVILRIYYLEQLPIPDKTLHRLLDNLMRSPSMRCLFLEVLSVLLTKRCPSNNVFFDQIKERNIFYGDPFPPSDSMIAVSSKSFPSLVASNLTGQGTNALPHLVGNRLLAALSYLCFSFPTFVYDMLHLIYVDGEEEEEVDDNGRESTVVTCKSHKKSYVEMLIQLLQYPNFSNSSANLLILMKLINHVVEPLSNLLTSATTNTSSESKDDDHGYKYMDIPAVVVSKSSLRLLCDALLSDLCTKEIFDIVISSITRLSNVQENRSVLLTVMKEVTAELGEYSRAKMDSFFTLLDTKNITGSTLLSTISIPIGEIGNVNHLRLYRSLQTLESLAIAANCKLTDIAPIDDLMGLWCATDGVLRLLGKYIQSEDPSIQSNASKKKSHQDATLLTILNKLLPVLESFFLVYSSDILNQKPDSEETKLNAVDIMNDDESKIDIHDSSSNNIPALQLSRQQSVPGAKYRKSDAFSKFNLSLFGSMESPVPLLDDSSRPSLKPSRSLRISSASAFGTHLNHAQQLIAFVQFHANIINLLIKSYPSLIETSFASLIKISQLRAFVVFDVKRSYFYAELKKRRLTRSHHNSRTIHLQVRRDNIFEDSFHQLRSRTAEEMKGRLYVNFQNEDGVDAGGLTREWYLVLSREIFNPNYCLFLAAGDGVTFQPNPLSNINSNHLDYFKFVGRVIGKALVDGQLMDGHFTRSFYKHVLGVPVEYGDIEGIEPEYYKSLKQILEYPLADLGLELTFSADTQIFGRHEVVDLISNGRNIPVTDLNKMDYIRLISHHSMTASIRSQIINFLDGFHDLVPAELISIFSPTELELLICGLPDVDIEDLHNNTDYNQYRESEEYIQWFWETLRAFTREEKALFLQFVTGTSKVPLDGFASLQGMRGPQKFSIHRAYGDGYTLPSAHTCFNQLDLPQYATKDELRNKLLLAIKEGSEGFGFA